MEWIIPIVILILVLRFCLKRQMEAELPAQEEIEEMLANDEEYQQSQAQLQQLVVYRNLKATVRDDMTLDELIQAFQQMCALDVGELDMLLFETGTYDWGQGKHFEFSLVRQFQFLDPDEFVQLHLTVLYHPSPVTAMLRTTHWGEPQDGDFFRYVTENPAYKICKTLPIAKINVHIDET